MALILSITNVERLENGVSTQLRLDRRGAVIGRSPTTDWCLPDPDRHISAIHCEIDFRDGAYVLVDKSMNGVFVNGAQTRLMGPHAIAGGDVIQVGQYQIEARLDSAAAPAPAVQAPQTSSPAWEGWRPQASAAPVADESAWERPPPQAPISGLGPMSRHWAAPQVSAPAASSWAPPPPPPPPASGWSSPPRDHAPAAADVWGQLAAGNVVDWARGGFGDPERGAQDPLGLAPDAPRLRADPLGLPPTPAPATPTPASPGWQAPAAAEGWAPLAAESTPPIEPHSQARSAPPAPSSSPVAAPIPPAGGGELAAFLAGAGLQPDDLKSGSADALNAAGAAMRRLVAGLVVMLEARARAKSQLGAQGTSLEFDGNNPLKFARAPQKALAQLLNPPERGFMSTDRAIEDAFRDLQAHQMATLIAMQGALAATLARFSPEAIRGRAESGGLLARILPTAKEAALWQAYEREFEGVARGSDEAFMDVFAKEFRQAYERVSSEMKRKSAV